MADAHSTRIDLSRFQTRSWGWRKITLEGDRVIELLEQSFQAFKGINGILRVIQQYHADGPDDAQLNEFEVDLLLAGAAQLSRTQLSEICSFASDIEDKIEAAEKQGR